jgi:hypothetical protein
VKLIGRGEYVLDQSKDGAPENFGSTVKDCTHPTAPNRRFPDLITQRLTKATLSGGLLPYRPDQRKYLAGRCTEKKDDAERVERQLRKSAAALLLEPRIGERFGAIVIGASDMRTWVRLLDHPVEGKLPSSHGLDVGDSASRTCKHECRTRLHRFRKSRVVRGINEPAFERLARRKMCFPKTTGRLPATTRKHCDEREEG